MCRPPPHALLVKSHGRWRSAHSLRARRAPALLFSLSVGMDDAPCAMPSQYIAWTTVARSVQRRLSSALVRSVVCDFDFASSARRLGCHPECSESCQKVIAILFVQVSSRCWASLDSSRGARSATFRISVNEDIRGCRNNALLRIRSFPRVGRLLRKAPAQKR